MVKGAETFGILGRLGCRSLSQLAVWKEGDFGDYDDDDDDGDHDDDVNGDTDDEEDDDDDDDDDGVDADDDDDDDRLLELRSVTCVKSRGNGAGGS